MKSIFAVLPFCVALLSSASPLGDRAVFRRHTGAPLTRRYMLSSNFNYPEACSAGVVSTSSPGDISMPDNSTDTMPILSNVTDSTPPDNSTVTTPDLSNVTDSTLPDNSTVTAPIAVDNSTVSDSVDANATTSGDDSTTAPGPVDPTVSKRYWYTDFEDDWFNLCTSMAEDSFDESDPCFDYSSNGFSALFAEADVCAQQEVADGMITFAKSRGFSNCDDWIKVAIAYRRLPRESIQLFGFYPSTPYCTVQPINEELIGVWNEQVEGVSTGLFGGPEYPIVPFGDDASCPYGQSPDVTTCSCVDSYYGSVTNLPGAPISVSAYSTDTADMADSTSTDTTDMADSTSTDTADMADATLSAVNSTSDASDSTASAASSTSVAVDVSATTASSTDAAPDATATAQIDGNPNDPNGRRASV